MLILKNISKQYKGNKDLTLKNINIKFKSQGLVAILGPSGCGKTTLLNLIGGLDKPTGGKIIVDDLELNSLSEKDLDNYHHQYVGFIFQNYNLINYLNVEENIELVDNIKDKDKLLTYLHLADKKKRKVKKLSGGETQRVALARSLTNSKKLLLCDEPTGALDTKTTEEIMKLLKEFAKDRLVIVVTHNESIAKTYADRIIKMEDGCIISDSDPHVYEDMTEFTLKKAKIKYIRLLTIMQNNLKNKYKRNILSLIAFSVGLISLGLVLSLASGFNKSIEKEEKDSLSRYPLFISKNSTNLENSFKDIFVNEEKNYENNYLYSLKESKKNKITLKYINDLEAIESNSQYLIKTYLVDNVIYSISNNKISELKIQHGRDLVKDGEALLIMQNQQIDSHYLESIGLTKDKYNYDDLLGYKFKIKKKTYKIVGLAEVDPDSYLNNLSGLLLKENDFPKEIPLEVSIYPLDYANKLKIIAYLKKYPEVEYTDYSETIKNLSTTLVDGVSVVLIVFSFLALFVSTIMIGIISYISIIERIKEIGIFKSLGLRTSHIKFIFIGENIILGFLASELSYLLCKLISLPLNDYLNDLTGMDNILLIDSKLLYILMFISLFLNILGSYFPVRKTKKLKIVDCLKYE